MALTSKQHGQLLTPAEASAYCGLSVKTLAQYRCQRVGPPYVKAGPGIRAKVFYPRVGLEEWHERQLQLHEPIQ